MSFHVSTNQPLGKIPLAGWILSFLIRKRKEGYLETKNSGGEGRRVGSQAVDGGAEAVEGE